jgi:hypothetical protein
MGEYQQTSINLRPDQLEYLRNKSLNNSDLIRTLLDGYVNGGEDGDFGVEHRRKEIENEIEQLELKLNQRREELASLNARQDKRDEIEKRQDGLLEILDEVHLQFKNYPPSKIGSSQRFTDIAYENGMGLQQLKNEYLEYRQSMGD